MPLAGLLDPLAAMPTDVPAEMMAEMMAESGGGDRAWPPARLGLLDHLFGRGFMLPGGAPELLKLIKPLHLTMKSNLLVAGIGVGGPVQAIAGSVGCGVLGFEANETLLARSKDDPGAADRPNPPLRPWDPQDPAFGHAVCTRALAIMALALGPAEPLLAAIGNALRANGQVVLIELVADGPVAAPDPDLARFLALEGLRRVRDEIEISRILGRLGFSVRATDDLSADHTRLAVLDWRRMLNGTPKSQLAADPGLLVNEAERWAVRGRLLRSGKLRLMRWHAVLRGSLGERAALDSAGAPA